MRFLVTLSKKQNHVLKCETGTGERGESRQFERQNRKGEDGVT